MSGLTCYFDGHPSPRKLTKNRPARAAWLIVDEAGETIRSNAADLWLERSTPAAEYLGLLAALRGLLMLQPSGPVRICGDSKIVISQVRGQWSTRAPEMVELLKRALGLIEQIEERGATVTLEWLPREKNKAHNLIDNKK